MCIWGFLPLASGWESYLLWWDLFFFSLILLACEYYHIIGSELEEEGVNRISSSFVHLLIHELPNLSQLLLRPSTFLTDLEIEMFVEEYVTDWDDQT